MGMKCLIPILILLTACSEVDRNEPVDSSQTVPNTQLKSPFQGLTFDTLNNDEIQSQPEVVQTGFKQINAWRGAKDFQNDSDSNDYFVYQTLKAQLNCDQLQIRSVDPVHGSLRYEAKCRGMRYLVQYDLNSVQIMNVIRE
ncbi:hypothetical protein Pan241w_33210 [Gimesia alba]|uniref:Lipoprotein n=2 Tax=Gimesia alba TaxID=2527973 RepID=A0A517RH61_9PLAN|nr:hypothetical protein Pan241w_33210 [Gimesia alba]